MTTWTIGWWTDAEQQRAAAAVAAALGEWTVLWEGQSRLPSVTSIPWTGVSQAADWKPITGRGDRDGVWMTHPDAAGRELGIALCGSAGEDAPGLGRHGGPLAFQAGSQAAHALAAALCTHFDWNAADESREALPSGLERGGLAFALCVGNATLQLAFSAGVCRAVAGRKAQPSATSLVALQEVIGQRPISLSVALQPVRLEIGSLCSLAVGDVIALDHKLDDPVTLGAADGCFVAQAHLAKVGVRKAVRLERAIP